MSASVLLSPNAKESYKHLSVTHFQLTTAPVNGYVLTCDAQGNGGWTEAGGFGVESIISAGPALNVNNTDPQNPIIGFTGNCAGIAITTNTASSFTGGISFATGSGGLNYYDVNNSIDMGAPTGAVTSGDYVITGRRIGNLVTLTFPTFTPNGANSNSTLGFTNLLPTAYRPNTDLTQPIAAIDNGSPTFGVGNIGSSGALVFGLTAATGKYTASTTATGFLGFSVSYSV
jgi:hypothetical protein